MPANTDKRAAYNTLDAIKAAGVGPVKRKARTGLYVVLGLSLIEEFLVKDVLRWGFPAFDGVPYDLTFPLLLSRK